MAGGGTGNPDGLSAPSDASTVRKLAHLNRLRLRTIRPLERLRAALYPGRGHIGGREFAGAVYAYLTDVQAARLVRLQAARLQGRGEGPWPNGWAGYGI